jgi:DNA-binding response OmpR family regulator
MDNAHPTSGRRVLIVDDDPDLIDLLTDGLQLVGGYEVVVAPDGANGLETFMQTRPDCVVVDVRMPGLNGYQFVRALRGDPATAQAPIVVLSALAQDHDQLAGMLSGADAYLFKPVKMTDLTRTIEHVMQLTAEQRSQQLRALAEQAVGDRGEP